jgi:hypothetical protein
MVAMMARTVAELPQGSRITDYISLGVLNKMIPRPAVDAALKATGRQSARQRDLPAHVVVYYVIALALYMQSSYREVLRCLLEGLQWLADPSVGAKVAGKSGISQARTRLGFEPMQALHDAVVGPVGQPQEAGCGYRQWHLVSLDGSTLDVADERANAQVVTSLSQGMLCLADRNFFGYALWNQAHSTGAELLWRVKKNLRLPCKKRLPDGSYLSRIYPSEKDRRQQTRGRRVRVIEYQLDGVHDAEPLYRLVTSILADAAAPAQELAALYHERWEIETALDELKTHLRGARIILRSKTPDLVRQEFWGLMLAHFAIRSLMHEAARHAGEDPDRLSYVHAVRVVRRKILTHGSIPPSAPSNLPSAGAP